MIVRNQFLAVSIVLMAAVCAFAQENYRAGLYVNNQSDTVKGFINYKEWVRNPASIKFKKTLELAKADELVTRQIKYFEVLNAAYERAYVSISQNDVNLDRRAAALPVKNDSVLLELLQQGVVATLCRYRDDIKTRYYLKEGNGTYYELAYEVEDLATGPRIRHTYKAQLHAAAAREKKLTPKLEWQIKNANYGANALMAIVSAINGSDNKISTLKENRAATSVSAINIYVGAGLHKSDLVYTGGQDWSKSSSSSYSPYFTVGLNYQPNTLVGRFSLRGEVSFNTASFHTVANNLVTPTPEKVDYTFNQFATNLALVVNHSLYRTDKLKIFGGLGMRATFSSYSNNMYTITDTNVGGTRATSVPDYFSLARSYYSFVIRSGVQLSNKVEAVIEYNPSLAARVNNYFQLWSETMITSRIGMNYFLGRKK